MAFELKVSYEVPAGQKFVSLFVWARSLPIEEQKIYAEARARNEALRTEQIELGFIHDHDQIRKKVIWEDMAETSEIKNTDPIWLEYYQRWLRETNTTEVFTKIEV